MLDNEAPTKIKAAGEFLFCEINPPLAIQIVCLIGWVWFFAGPAFVFLAARHRWPVREAALYAVGAIATVVLFMGLEWCVPFSENFPHRFAVLWGHGGFELTAMATALCGTAIGLGRVFRARPGVGRT